MMPSVEIHVPHVRMQRVVLRASESWRPAVSTALAVDTRRRCTCVTIAGSRGSQQLGDRGLHVPPAAQRPRHRSHLSRWGTVHHRAPSSSDFSHRRILLMPLTCTAPDPFDRPRQHAYLHRVAVCAGRDRHDGARRSHCSCCPQGCHFSGLHDGRHGVHPCSTQKHRVLSRRRQDEYARGH